MTLMEVVGDRSVHQILCILLMLILGVSSGLPAQEPPQSQDRPAVAFSRCTQDGNVLVWGQVVDELGVPLHGAQVYVPGTICGTLADSAGFFALAGLVPGESLRFEYILRRPVTADVPATGDTVRIDAQLERVPLRTDRRRDFSSFDERPAALPNPEGLTGCYWLGSPPPWVASVGRAIQLNPDGTATVQDPSWKVLWIWQPKAEQVWIRFAPYSVLSHTFGSVKIGPNPDWSNLPVSIEHLSDADIGVVQILETFAVRIPCTGTSNDS